MSLYFDKKPIIACSTGTSSNAAIAVIRLSGFKLLSDLQSFFSLDLSAIRPRYAHLTNLTSKSHVLDNILITFFPASSSYNGENIIEMSVHGNQLNISRIIEHFINSDYFRLAGPGEFSFRALKNGKLSLTQIEGLDMLLNANSALMLDQGMQILQGELHQKYLGLYDSFLKLKSSIELSIDFSEDIGDLQSKILLQNSLNSFREILSSLYTRTLSSNSSLMSPDIVICGETNAGKSSLFNLLLKHNRSIVSSAPGTTRDYISEVISIASTNFRLVDTAGIRDSDDFIEKEGIDRALDILQKSFFKILVIDPTNFNQKYLKRFQCIDFDLVIFSHLDSPNFSSEIAKIDMSFILGQRYFLASFLSGSIGPLFTKFITFSTGPIEPVVNSGPIEPLIKDIIATRFAKLAATNPILLDRHRICIGKIYKKFAEIDENIAHTDDVAIISSEINVLAIYLSELVGIVSPDEVLNSIFSNFCIGK
jgi:tRNA modification GTPase